MTGNDDGSIIQISSSAATITVDNYAAYIGSKAGTDNALRNTANEFVEFGNRANSIGPGRTATLMAAAAFANPTMVDAYVQKHPLGRRGTAENAVETAVHLAFETRYMGGPTPRVNVGLTPRRNPRGAELEAANRYAQ